MKSDIAYMYNGLQQVEPYFFSLVLTWLILLCTSCQQKNCL